MTNTIDAGQVLTMERRIRAPREKVFAAFTSADALKRWMCPRGMSIPRASVDAREGGEWQLSMRTRDGTTLELGGVYREIRAPERIAYTFCWGSGGPMPGHETLVVVDLVERDGGTELRMQHSGFDDCPQRDAHGQGWASTLNQLSDLIDERGTAASLCLLGDARSTYTRSVRMALCEKGLGYSFEQHGPHSDAINALHPFGRIPVLRDGDIVLWETTAIIRYLDECFEGDAALLPSTIIGRTRCEQWVSAINSYLYDSMVRRYVLQYIFPRGADGRPDRAVIDAALAEMPRQLAAVDAAYGDHDWLAGGGGPSIADLLLAPIMQYLEAMPEGPTLLRDAPRLRRAQGAIRQRRCFTDTEPPRGAAASPEPRP